VVGDFVAQLRGCGGGSVIVGDVVNYCLMCIYKQAIAIAMSSFSLASLLYYLRNTVNRYLLRKIVETLSFNVYSTVV
jgi:hypothetical protein